MAIYEKIFKAGFTDLSTGEFKQFHYNPESWTSERFVQFSSISIPGINSPRFQFIAGGESIIHMKLFLNALNHKKGAEGVLDFVHWIEKRTVVKKSKSIIGVAPPKILFLWPGIGSYKCNLTSCNLEWQAFFPNGKPKHCTIDIELKKIYD